MKDKWLKRFFLKMDGNVKKYLDASRFILLLFIIEYTNDTAWVR